MVVYPSTPEENLALCAWVAQRIEGFVPGDAQCISVCSPTEILAVACYNNYYPNRDIEISFASDHPRWATKNSIRELLGYPFKQLNVQRVSARAPKSNKRTRKLMKGIGFVEEGKLRHAGRNNESLFIYGLLREDYTERYGIKEAPAESTAST